MLLSASLPPIRTPFQYDPAHLTFRSPIALSSYPPTPTHTTAVRQGAGWTVHRRGIQVSNPSGVQPVHCPAGWCPPGWCPPGWCPPGWRPARPASNRLSSTRPPCRIRLVPRQPVAAMGDTRYRRGNGHDWIESSSMWPGPVPGGSVDGPMRHRWMRAPLRRSCGGRRGSVGRRTWAGVVRRREAAADRPGRPDRRQGCPSVATALGQGLADAMLPHGTAGRPSGLEPRLRCVVVTEPNVRVDGPGRLNELDGQDGARPQRGPAR
jgi:hypothetical protein